jgi:hypothetical protein
MRASQRKRVDRMQLGEVPNRQIIDDLYTDYPGRSIIYPLARRRKPQMLFLSIGPYLRCTLVPGHTSR